MSEKAKLEEVLRFYKDGLPQLESELHHHIICAYQTQEKLDEYKGQIMFYESNLGEKKDE